MAQTTHSDREVKLAELDANMFDVANGIPKLDASINLDIDQVTGNVPALDANGKLILTGANQISTKTADLANLWTKGTLIDDSMIGLSEIHEADSTDFAGSTGRTVTHNLNLSNYEVTVVPTEDGGGNIGEVWITDKGVNSFKVRNSGSATTAFTWVIHTRT
ncbi:MAG: hypothetical protein U9N01_04515 [Euryarchaeota archaeon]|nr:hypothetical protein [Euryarchaeota archaeon]